jgi:hypothetical protein
VARTGARRTALFDLARVKALSAPQAPLVVRNATGGLIQFVVIKPSLGGRQVTSTPPMVASI